MRQALNRSWSLAGGLLVALLLAGSVGAAPAPADPERVVEDALSQSSRAQAAVIKRVLPAVVHIGVVKTVEAEANVPEIFNDPFFRRFFGPQGPQQPQEREERGMGSGFIVSPDGYILTNNHVAGDSSRITVKLRDGSEYDAKLVGADPATDLAVIKIDAKNLPTLQFRDSRDLEVGETVIAIGNPFGLEQTVTQGIVSAKGRSQLGLSEYEDFIQTDASINPGNSGGPLIDAAGKVVGVNSAIFSRSGGSMGIGFAIPSSLAQHIMTALVEHGEVHRGYLGVSIQDMTRELSDAMGIEYRAGVLISGVEPGSAADKAGLRQGDLVTGFNNQPVANANELRVRVADVEPGSRTPVALLRDGKPLTVSVTLAERPGQKTVAQRDEAPEREPSGSIENKLGLAVQGLTPELAARLDYKGLQGVLVSAVKPDSPAAEAGLQRGALIQRVGRQTVRSVAEFRKAVQEAKAGQSLLLLVRLGNATRFVALPVS